ncbi:peptidase C15 [Ancylobacter pratisalsi]|uniref:Pyroglutamyl-peptidase I n=1 Tax=Ancylobacter pratisalsi TaxID=1745854 RepID=A0A6P1YQ78_9HYPH|nr:peptidase C15 [Ancylobacter pratisalsi]QIB35060.1 peptidase C15 [Ancylobacter pratisalsi]
MPDRPERRRLPTGEADAGKPRILITGFGRFPGAPSNPSGFFARKLARSRRVHDARLDVRVLPTSWDEAARFPSMLDRIDPDIVLMIGLAARRPQVCVELIGRNATGMFPDANRRRPAARRLAKGGADTYACAASPAPLLHALRQSGVPARVSRDAGRYVCNALAFSAYGWARRTGQHRLAVFVHIPLPHAGVLSAARLERGLEAVLAALLAEHRSSRLTGVAER